MSYSQQQDPPWLQGVQAVNQGRNLWNGGSWLAGKLWPSASGVAEGSGSAAGAAGGEAALDAGIAAGGTAAAEEGAVAAAAPEVLEALAAVGAASSDARIKDNIRPVGLLYNGLPVYAFNFKGGSPTTIGLLAQDVAKVMPQAVSRGPHGLLQVNYDMATMPPQGGANGPA